MILIDMQMPKNCQECFCNCDTLYCPVSGDKFDWDSFAERRLEKCPLKEVVRCCECVHSRTFREFWGDYYLVDELLDRLVCSLNGLSVDDNNSCYRGERKKE